jgi:hypothetical protein
MGNNPDNVDASMLQAFGHWLHQQRRGALHEELSIKFAELNQAVMETGKPGTLTLTVTVKRAGKGIQFIVTDSIRTKLPENDPEPSFFFFDEESGTLSRNDPYQPELPLAVSLPKRTPMEELERLS